MAELREIISLGGRSWVRGLFPERRDARAQTRWPASDSQAHRRTSSPSNRKENEPGAAAGKPRRSSWLADVGINADRLRS